MNVFLIVVDREHMDELKKISSRHVYKRHKEEFVSWFERKVSGL
jgi:hypothetical protein